MRDLIHQAAEALAIRPKITEYANCVGVAFRNSDNQRVLVTLDHGSSFAQITHALAYAYKVKPGVQISREASEKLKALRDAPVAVIDQ